MLSEFSGSPPSIRITEPATPIPVTGRTPFLGHGFLGPFDYGPFEGFPDGIARRLAKYANKDHQGWRLYLIVTLPPYFDLVKYEGVQYEGSKPWSSPYAKFLDDMMGVWVEAAQQLGRFPMRASRRAPTDPP